MACWWSGLTHRPLKATFSRVRIPYRSPRQILPATNLLEFQYKTMLNGENKAKKHWKSSNIYVLNWKISAFYFENNGRKMQIADIFWLEKCKFWFNLNYYYLKYNKQFKDRLFKNIKIKLSFFLLRIILSIPLLNK